jgi:hypothetical protein
MSKLSLTVICFLTCLLAEAQPMEVYGSLTGKTVLASALPRLPEAMISDLPTDKSNAIAKIEKELSKMGIAIVQDGPHFVRIFPESQVSFFIDTRLRGAELAASNSLPKIQPGEIEFVNIGVDQVLYFYGLISRRTMLRAVGLPPISMSLKTTCEMTQDEAAYALTTVLAFNGIAVIEDGEKFAEIVPISQRELVKPNAPKPEAGEKMFNPKEVPSLGETRISTPVTPPATETEREIARLRKAVYEFFHSSPPDYSAKRLLDFYADISVKSTQPSKNFDAIPMWFQVGTPLSKNELLYAIEETFALNNLAIIQVNDREIRLGKMGEAGGGTGKTEAYSQPK